MKIKVLPKISGKKFLTICDRFPDCCSPIITYVLPLIALALYSFLGGWLFCVLESPAPPSTLPQLHNLTDLTMNTTSGNKPDEENSVDSYITAYKVMVQNLSQFLKESKKTTSKYDTVQSFWREMSTGPQASSDNRTFGGRSGFGFRLTTAAWRAYLSNLKQTEQFLETLLDSQKTVRTHSDGDSFPSELSAQENVWTIWNSTLFATTLYTTIGYGNIAPQTTLGRISTILYSMIGIPLLLAILRLNGTALFNFLVFLKETFSTSKQNEYRSLSLKRNSVSLSGSGSSGEENQDLPLYASMLVLLFWLCLCAGLFLLWEDWDYFTSWYFFFITTTTIGLGDVVPKQPKYTLLAFVFVLIGLSAVSMSFNIIQMKVELMFNNLMKNIDAEYKNKQCGDHVEVACGADEKGGDQRKGTVASGGMGVFRFYERKPLREKLVFNFLMDKHRKKMLENYYTKKTSTHNAGTQTHEKNVVSVNIQCIMDEKTPAVERTLGKRTYLYNVID